MVPETPEVEALLALTDKKDGERAVQEMARELVRRGVVPEELGRLRRYKAYQGYIKNADDEIETVDLHAFELAPSWDEGPRWPVVQPGPTVRVPTPKRAAKQPDHPCTVVLPDMQCGHFRNAAGDLEAIHDEAAINAALAVTAAANPTQVVLLGDNLDAADFSKYRSTPAFAGTTQATIDYLTVLMGRLRAAAPEADIVWLAGNHEERIVNYTLDNAKAAFGLRQGMSPESWPVLSIPHLCRLDEHGVTYKPGYPASEVWITSQLRAIHGDRVRSKGSTAHAYIPDLRTSVIYGHVHRIEAAYATRTDHDGPVTVGAFSPGCLARVDGVVPSHGQGVDLDGRPLNRPENWQNGMAVVTTFDDGSFNYEQVLINSGSAFWRGKAYFG
jgi:predicted phosphodiesterase